ncbi:MAG: PilZ domain-containing protein [Gemmatimonadota bacterium]
MDESFRRILPYFRLQEGDAPWMYPWLVELVALVSLALLLLLVTVLVVRRIREYRHTWSSFRECAGEHGLSAPQTELVRRIAREARMRHPLLLLTSVEAFDRRVGAYLERRRDHPERPAIVDSLAHVRRLLEFDRVPAGRPLRSTRELHPGQRLMVWPVKGGPSGFIHCVVAHRDDDAIVAVPLLREDDRHLQALEVGDRIKVRFWREHDTEYRFRSQILEANPETTSIVVGHSDRLERIQKRDYYRLAVRFRLGLVAVPEDRLGAPEEIPAGRRFEAIAADISGGGLGVTAEAVVPPGHVVVIDPAYTGPFPIAGLWCRVVAQEQREGARWLGLEFADISRERQTDLVNVIFQQQIHRVTA